MKTFDAIIVGAGQAGPSLAGRFAAAGMTVALIERKFVGGTCVNAGCMPTKTLVASARTAHVIRRSADYGIRRDGGMLTDMAAVERRAAAVTNNTRNSLTAWLTSTDGISLIRGHARFESAKTISVADETLFHRCWTALRRGGRLVANAVTLEAEAALISRQARLGGELTRIEIAHLDTIGDHRAMRPRIPVTQWSVIKP